ncbi:MAG: (Fe-S)-binding protein [Thermodesulfobacteriota bacterium]|nr:(Fe-S)-binding protein [Thermodesulfobacteriota bacterium]
MEAVAPYKEISDLIKDSGGEEFRLCFQCGLCTVSCPWNIVRSFIPHKMMRQAQLGLVDLEDEGWWLCSTCNMCVSRCPRGVAITDVMEAIRSIMLEYQYNMAPASLRNAMGSLSSLGNPWGEERDKRAEWVRDLDVKTFSPDNELLYFPGCVPAYDPGLGSIARATASILQKTGANFGILGAKENCCGESVRKTGNKSLFENLMKSNINAFKDSGVTEIVVTSPHCYTTFKDEYPGFGGDFEVIHFTQYLARLLNEGKLKFTKELNKKVVYHDPCYLGRHNGIYDEPRDVLRRIPGLVLMDEVDSRENSLCCGGGGGRIWMETLKGERFSDILVEQAVELGADILVTACPYCILNFKDSVLTANKADVLEIKDISEVVDVVI